MTHAAKLSCLHHAIQCSVGDNNGDDDRDAVNGCDIGVSLYVPPSEYTRERIQREKRELEAALGVVAHAISTRADQLTVLSRYPENDPFTDGDILYFCKRCEPLGDDDPISSIPYIAFRYDGVWLLTGISTYLEWSDLVEIMGFDVTTVLHMNAVKNDGTIHVVEVIH